MQWKYINRHFWKNTLKNGWKENTDRSGRRWVRMKAIRRVSVDGGQKDLVHRRNHGNVVLTSWANPPKGLATNPGQAYDCGRLIPTNLLVYPQNKTPLMSQEQFWMFCRDCKVGMPSLDLVHITGKRKKQVRKHRRHKKLSDFLNTSVLHYITKESMSHFTDYETVVPRDQVSSLKTSEQKRAVKRPSWFPAHSLGSHQEPAWT